MSELTKRLRKWQYEFEITDFGEAADRIDKLEECLRELLDDTQHSEHSCTDADCPVAKARALLEEK